MRIIIYNWKDSVAFAPKELGLKHIPYIGYEVVNKPLFLLYAIKYGIDFREAKS